MITIITFQNYVRPQSLEEAWELNQKKRNRILGGMMWLKMTTQSFGTVIDLCDLGLDTIEETEDEFRIGAMVTLRQLEKHEGLNAFTCGTVKRAFQDIVGVQFRNTATVGGSLWRRMGFSDIVTLFRCMDSYVELYEGGIVPLYNFTYMKYDKDIIVRLIVKKTPSKFAYQVMRKQSTDLPSLNVAVSTNPEEGESVRVIVGSRPCRATSVPDPKNILADGITEESAAAFADYAAEIVPTGSNLWGSAEYRTHLVRVLVRRALLDLKEKL